MLDCPTSEGSLADCPTSEGSLAGCGTAEAAGRGGVFVGRIRSFEKKGSRVYSNVIIGRAPQPD